MHVDRLSRNIMYVIITDINIKEISEKEIRSDYVDILV